MGSRRRGGGGGGELLFGAEGGIKRWGIEGIRIGTSGPWE